MSFTCPFCGATSHHPMDAREAYCNRCRLFLEEAPHIWVVWSFEHEAWWGPAKWGYTPELAEAGHYTQAEAAAIVAQANVVAVNEQALLLSEAQAFGPPRYSVVAEHNPHGGDGWAIYDREQQRVSPGAGSPCASRPNRRQWS